MTDDRQPPTGEEPEGCPSGEPLVLTVDEAAGLLRLNRKSVYEAIRRGELPGVRRVGAALRIHRETLVRWLASGATIGSPCQGARLRSRRDP